LLNRKFVFLLLIISLVVVGCGQGTEPESSQTDLAASETPAPTLTPEPSPTSLVPVGVFITPDGSDPTLVETLNPLLGSYLRAEGLRFQVLPRLTEEDFSTESYAIVVVIPPYPEITNLAESAPDTKFLAIGFSDLEPGENLSVLESGGGDYDIQGFVAGYIAAMVTTDWRVGVLSMQDDPDALEARDGFRTGVKYFCGLCNPKYAPTGINYVYPKYIDLPTDATEQQISANIDFMVDRVVNTFFIVPGVGTTQIYQTLIGYEKNIIGSGADFREEYSEFWVASLDHDLVAALEEFWPQFLEADSGLTVTPPLLLTDVNYELLSEGKILLVEDVLQDVSSGYIKTSYD
jgi:hypothetical protein